MVMIKRFGNEYYLCGYYKKKEGRIWKKKRYKHQFFIKYNSNIKTNCGTISVGGVLISCPKEFVGKRVRLKMEVVE